MDTYFRIAFVVEYKSEAEFTLKSIDLGDPCVFNNTTYNTCTDRGECVQISVNDYKCECEPGFFLKDCQGIDNCEHKHNVSHLNLYLKNK